MIFFQRYFVELLASCFFFVIVVALICSSRSRGIMDSGEVSSVLFFTLMTLPMPQRINKYFQGQTPKLACFHNVYPPGCSKISTIKLPRSTRHPSPVCLVLVPVILCLRSEVEPCKEKLSDFIFCFVHFSWVLVKNLYNNFCFREFNSGPAKYDQLQQFLSDQFFSVRFYAYLLVI